MNPNPNHVMNIPKDGHHFRINSFISILKVLQLSSESAGFVKRAFPKRIRMKNAREGMHTRHIYS